MQRSNDASCVISDEFVRRPEHLDPGHQAGSDEGPQDHTAIRQSCHFKQTPWSEDEDAILRDLASQRVTSREIALKLSRTLAAIRNRARIIGIQLAHASQVGACRQHRRMRSPSIGTRTDVSFPRFKLSHDNLAGDAR
jgi:hypothetical protein